MGDNLHTTLQESYVISCATKCSKHLYSLSFSPPKDTNVSPEQFEQVIDRAEERLVLNGQPLVIFHEKHGRDGELPMGFEYKAERNLTEMMLLRLLYRNKYIFNLSTLNSISCFSNTSPD